MGSSTLQGTGIGIALREARKKLGWDQRRCALETGYSNASISRWETGEGPPRAEDLAVLLTLMQVPAEERQQLLAVHRKRNDPQWVAVDANEQQTQITTLLELERTATKITVVSPLLIPGLLQTYDYARAIMERAGVPSEQVTTRVALRMGRREAISRRRKPADLYAYVGMAALRQQIGGPEVMTDQLRALPGAAQQPNVHLRVLPDDCDWHPGLEGPFVLVEFSDRTPVVQIENRRSAVYFVEQPDTDEYVTAADKVSRVAMSPSASEGLIAQAITDAEKRLEIAS